MHDPKKQLRMIEATKSALISWKVKNSKWALKTILVLAVNQNKNLDSWWIETEKSAHYSIFTANEWVTNSKMNRITVKPTYVGSMCMVARRRRWRRRNSLNGSDGCGWKILRNSALVTCQKEEIQWPRSSAVLSLRLLLFFPHFIL